MHLRLTGGKWYFEGHVASAWESTLSVKERDMSNTVLYHVASDSGVLASSAGMWGASQVSMSCRSLSLVCPADSTVQACQICALL